MFGKREQIVGLAIGGLLSIGLIHGLIFSPRAREYSETLTSYKEGNELLAGAKMPASPSVIPNFNKKTKEYQDQVTSVVEQINLGIPPHYQKPDPANIAMQVEEINGLIKELVLLRKSVKQPVLTFLDNKVDPATGLQAGWNFPPDLPINNAQALGDLMKKVVDKYRILESISDPSEQLQARADYNRLVEQLGLKPLELNYWFFQDPRVGVVFFNDEKLVGRLGTGAQPNIYGISRFGPFVPQLKRMWFKQLIGAKLQGADAIDSNALQEILEIKIDLKFVLDGNLLYISRQLRGLIDIIKIAERNKITEITQVNLMKPSDFAKVPRRDEKAATPAAAKPAEQGGAAGEFGGTMGFAKGFGPGGGAPAVATVAPDQRVGQGTGIEIYFRASNSNMVDFLFDLGTTPRSYAVDDLYITARPNNEVETSTTIELLTKLESKGGS